MKSTYRVRVRPGPPVLALMYGLAPLTEQTLKESLAGAVVRELTQVEGGDYIVDVRIQRPTHAQAVNDVLVVAQNTGYSLVEGTVSEWANAATQGAVTGLLGGGGVGLHSRDPGVALVATALGCVVGAAVGSTVEKEKVVYRIQPTYRSGWVLTPTSEETYEEPEFGAGFAYG